MVHRLTVMSDNEVSMSEDHVPSPSFLLSPRKKQTMKCSVKQSQTGPLSSFWIFVPVSNHFTDKENIAKAEQRLKKAQAELLKLQGQAKAKSMSHCQSLFHTNSDASQKCLNHHQFQGWKWRWWWQWGCRLFQLGKFSSCFMCSHFLLICFR